MVDINCNLQFYVQRVGLVAVKMSLSEVCEDNGDGGEAILYRANNTTTIM